jgi:anthranilate phosphoribosyltransferase
MNAISWTDLLHQLMGRQSLCQTEATQLMIGWLQGEIPPELSGAILIALQMKGVTADELAGMARVLQEQSVKADLDLPSPRVDTCGTGGDGASTFNISTAVTFVTAAAGVAVVKHGSRSASSRVGSADVLESLGVNLLAPAELIRAAVKAVGVTFLFAPGWHPAMKAVAPIRGSLKIRTVFNLLGPLVNPLKPTGQVIGVYDPSLIEPMTGALQRLGIDRAMVVYGRERVDEACLGDLSDRGTLHHGNITIDTIDPKALGLTPAPLAALKGDGVEENGEILRSVLQGKGTAAQRDVVALNTALALMVADHVPDLAAGVKLAQEVIASGAAWDKLESLVAFLRA